MMSLDSMRHFYCILVHLISKYGDYPYARVIIFKGVQMLLIEGIIAANTCDTTKPPGIITRD